MMNRERIQLCQECRNTAMPKVLRTTHHKAKSDVEEHVTKDSRSFNKFQKHTGQQYAFQKIHEPSS